MTAGTTHADLEKRLSERDLLDEAKELAEYADTADIGGDPLVADMANMIRALANALASTNEEGKP